MPSKFTEQDTETFYDGEDAIYRSFWDEEGSLHWGYFDDGTGRDFLKACANLNKKMAEKARFNPTSKVLDLGCGNGNTATWLGATNEGCRITGIDLSGVRIDNANQALQSQPLNLRERVLFEKASATDLPYGDGSFTHVWSQAVIYHIHDKKAALREVYRVLEPGGILIFDDLIKPKSPVSQAAKIHVYDRLLFDTDFSFQSYQDALRETGFQILEAEDLSQHLKTSYQCLGEMAGEQKGGYIEKYQALSAAYEQMVLAMDNDELGWGLYLCQK